MVNNKWLWFFLCRLFYSCVLVLSNPDAKRLYDDLLSNYNRLIRPVSNNTDTVLVKLGLRLSQLIELVRIENTAPTTHIYRYTSQIHKKNASFFKCNMIIYRYNLVCIAIVQVKKNNFLNLFNYSVSFSFTLTTVLDHKNQCRFIGQESLTSATILYFHLNRKLLYYSLNAQQHLTLARCIRSF